MFFVKTVKRPLNAGIEIRRVIVKSQVGVRGIPGTPGQGVPIGGTSGQYLKKQSSTDYDTTWSTITKSEIGLGNVDNTSDANKPISSATQAELNTKATDSAVVHLQNAEDIAGKKTFLSNFILVSPDGSKWEVSILNDGSLLTTSLIPADALLDEDGLTILDENGETILTS